MEQSSGNFGYFGRTIANFSACARLFIRDTAANAAMIFGIAVIPLIMAGGAAVDFSRAFLVQQRLSAALDATALAVGSSSQTDPTELSALAQSYFDANFPASEIGTPGNLQLTIDGATVTLSATAQVQTTLMQIAGFQTLDVNSYVEVTREQTALEVTLVLDNTGSMNSSGKITALKQASTDLVNLLFGQEENPALLKFALVPFAASVNIGSQYLNSGWMDNNAANSLHGVQFEAGSQNVWDQYAKLVNKSWNGCVEARPAPFDILDTPPDPANGDTLWVPYFAPDEPDSWAAGQNGFWYGNNYLGDDVGNGNTNVDLRQRKVSKYDSETVNADGPYFNCKNQPIQPLSNSKTTILNAVNQMTAAGSTVIPIGLAWGWRVLSPEQPFTQGASYSDPTVKKVIILLTDGKNDIGNLPNHNTSWYNGYGYISQGRLGTTNSAQAHVELNNRTAQLCTNIKTAGILIYTITFQVSDPTIQNLMRNCATTQAMYFDSPSNSELQQNFQEIAAQLGKLRISK